MRDLLTDPAWHPDDLGQPLPDSPHAVSVAMPLWEHVIGYEEEDPAVLGALQCGYPRFFLHPRVQELNLRAEAEYAGPGERALVFPNPSAAARALAFLGDARGLTGGRLEDAALVVPRDQHRAALDYWRFSGEIVSSRAAENFSAAAVDTGSHAEVRERVAALAGQSPADVFLVPSGMAATFSVHRMFQEWEPERRPLQIEFPYVDVLKVQAEFGYGGGIFFPQADAGVLSTIGRERPCAVFCELASNPLMRSIDLESLTPVCRKAEVPLAIDDTVATSFNVDLSPFADVVTTSLTKYFSGAGDVLAGAIVVNSSSAFADEMRAWLRREMGPGSLHQADAAALAVASRDVRERIATINSNAQDLVGMLSGHPAVEHVYYPTTETPALYDQILRPGAPGGGGGGLLSIVLKNASQKTPAFYDRLQVSKGPSFGTRFTLACPYTLLAHYPELAWAESCGVSRYLVRVGVGIEPDLIARFEEALEGC